ncbi:MAG: hypothetical protein AVDCRST_MAG50-581, partial [uncultured Acidimicrobiales bacterium]
AYLPGEPEGRRQSTGADRRSPLPCAKPLGRRPTRYGRTERVPQDPQLGGLLDMAPRLDRGARRRDEGSVRVRLRRLHAPAPHGSHRLLLPGRRVGAHRGHGRSPRPPAPPRRGQSV